MWEIFSTWIDLCHAALDRLPSLITEIIQEGTPQPDPAEMAERWREHSEKFRYHPTQVFNLFARAFSLLIEASCLGGQLTYADVVGSTYMEVLSRRRDPKAQFFTPWNVATAMARMTLGGGQAEKMCLQRLKEAAREDPWAGALALTISAWPDREVARQKFWEQLVPYLLPRARPVTICDPACGSGILLLAAAKECPRWAIEMGLVQFIGVDIDPLCVEMARLNMRIYGISPLQIRPVDLLTLAEIDSLPWPYSPLYKGIVTDEPPGKKFWEEGVEMARAQQLELWSGLDKLPPPPEKPQRPHLEPASLIEN